MHRLVARSTTNTSSTSEMDAWLRRGTTRDRTEPAEPELGHGAGEGGALPVYEQTPDEWFRTGRGRP